MTVTTSAQIQRSQYDAQGTLRDERVWQPDGLPRVHRQYDADGHLLEDFAWDDRGSLQTAEEDVWTDGLLMGSQRFSGVFWSSQEWTYSAQRQAAQRVDWFFYKEGTREQNAVHQFVYEQGRLEQIKHHYFYQEDGEFVPSDYRYDEAGRLKSITTFGDPGCDSDLLRCESRVYDDAGRLRERSWNTYYSTYGHKETYDEQGRLLTTEYSDSNIEPTWEWTTRQYDAVGRLSSLQWSFAGYMSGSSHVIRYLYDDSNQPVLEWLVSADGAPRRITTRSTHICGTSLLYLKETDGDGDGVVDSRCTYARDAAGRLLLEECTSLATPEAPPTRTEYRYDCEP